MALNVYSTRFALEKNSTAWTSVDVPPGVVWVVRDISVVWGGLVSANGVFALGNVGFFSYNFAPVGPKSDHWDGRAVMYQGDHLDQSGAGDGVDFVISGYQLFLP